MATIRSVAFLAVMAAVACAPRLALAPEPVPLHGDEPVDWRAVVGCWRLSETWVFALDSVPAVTRFMRPGRDARRARSFRPRDQIPDVFWRVTPRNTVELIIDDGLHGFKTEFVVRDQTLVGEQLVLTDVVIVGRPPQSPHRVVAVRETCPAAAGESDAATAP